MQEIYLSMSGLSLIAINPIIPRIKHNSSIIDLQPADFLLDPCVSHNDLRSLVHLSPVDWPMEISRQLCMVNKGPVGSVDDGLEETGGSLNVPDKEDAARNGRERLVVVLRFKIMNHHSLWRLLKTGCLEMQFNAIVRTLDEVCGVLDLLRRRGVEGVDVVGVVGHVYDYIVYADNRN